MQTAGGTDGIVTEAMGLLHLQTLPVELPGNRFAAAGAKIERQNDHCCPPVCHGVFATVDMTPYTVPVNGSCGRNPHECHLYLSARRAGRQTHPIGACSRIDLSGLGRSGILSGMVREWDSGLGTRQPNPGVGSSSPARWYSQLASLWKGVP